MALRVYNNLFSVATQRHLANNNNNLASSLEKLASGLRINRASDDAAGLAISESLRGDIRSLNQAIRNSNDGIAMINTAEGALSQQSSILIRMRELSSQAATGTVGSAERQTINYEFTALRDEINRLAEVSEFNGQKLTNGSLANDPTVASVTIQIGLQNTANDRINLNTAIDLTAINASSLAIDILSLTGAAQALTALGVIDTAIATVADGRGRLGATQNRLIHTLGALAVAVENLSAAESQIRDADYASEISEFTKNQILVQASTAILAQANLVPQTVLQLLG